MSDTRRKDVNWEIRPGVTGDMSWDGAKLAVLMDIRDELKILNRLLGCQNFLEVPNLLRDIKRNTTKPRKPKQ